MGPVGAPVGDPPAGSTLTANAAVPLKSPARKTVVPELADTRPKDRGAP